MPLLSAQNIAWSPPDSDALLFADVDFDVDAGERVVLEGPSGSGKSTLLRCLVGLEPRRSGTVRWRGEPVDAESMRRFRNRATYVQQRPSAISETVGENLAFAREMARQFAGDRALDEDGQHDLLERLGLGHIGMSRRFDDLSVGEQQRVCLVRALTGQPDMLLLDEPTSALDPERVEQIEDLLIAYVDDAPDRRAFVWVSHQPDQIERISTRVLDVSQWTQERR
ncbi:ATP-binding cassette domain-containing protein [Persicimonas caeni]|uniref:ATP-binding cassette domain-containing protein n=1 Tax=Persicimonas caeni TaxID=2292766 RepID=A0A4Y6PRJ4_PERCE|nr:ATP-binding cassette domain-containing protein [Persicimonas caeni]QDG50637.1 ATP-binding cassette domain-containing protein [Persicimonas caeni]QED31858.1 ATP-binding cassette domain-containing protein [Persicimonas caeni]